MPGGVLSLAPEAITVFMCGRGWHLADKVYCRAANQVDILKSLKTSRRYFGSVGFWLRFTRLPPAEAYCDDRLFADCPQIWDRGDTEDFSWYSTPIELTCPPGGTVADPFGGHLVGEASLRADRNFIGIAEDIGTIDSHLKTLK